MSADDGCEACNAVVWNDTDANTAARFGQPSPGTALQSCYAPSASQLNLPCGDNAEALAKILRLVLHPGESRSTTQGQREEC